MRLRTFFFSFLAVVSTAVAQPVPRRYIVELNTDSVAEHVARQPKTLRSLRGADATSQRSRIRTEQATVRSLLEQRSATILESVDTVANAFFVDIADAQASQLASAPGVKRVIPVRTFHLLLDHATQLHKVQAAWAQIGGAEQAGKGVKIGIIDTGIDSTHPAFQNSSLTAPDTFPRADSDVDLTLTSGKIIVARSYVSLLSNRDPDISARDHVGHGTALAMISGGLTAAGPLATIEGVAPGAWLANYKIFGTPGFNDTTTDAAILKALDDAVNDGMDIVNMSFGDIFAARPADDIDVQAVERATQSGVIVVIAAGNDGPNLNTISTPASAPSAIAVGATTNDRTFASSVDVSGVGKFSAILGDATPASGQVSGTIATPPGDPLLCSSIPSGSLSGKVALILRGTCTFESKINFAANAGAVATVVYAASNSPDPIGMSVGSATLPAVMISNPDGVSIVQALQSGATPNATLDFNLSAVPVISNRTTSFSSAGPNSDLGIKPDLVAVGQDMYTATQSLDPLGDMYSADGFILVDGTSFSTPLVSGAAALIKSARPGLTVDQYRSLIINSAADLVTLSTGDPAPVQRSGAGLLDVIAALNSTVAVSPVSLSFGPGTTDIAASKTITLTNVGTSSDTFTLSTVHRTGLSMPDFGSTSVSLDPGASVDIPVNWNAPGVKYGTHDGFITITSSSGTTTTRVAYWYDATDNVPATITVLDSITSARRGSLQRDAIYFRITDSAGLPLPSLTPDVTSVSGGGTVRQVNNYDSDVPGVMSLDLQLGNTPVDNVFQIQAGPVSITVTITAR